MNENEHEELRCTECGEIAEPIFEPKVLKMHYFCPKCDKGLVTRSLTKEEAIVFHISRAEEAFKKAYPKDMKPKEDSK